MTLHTRAYFQKSFKSSTMQVWLRRYANINRKIIYPAGDHTLLVNIPNCPVPTYVKQDINYHYERAQAYPMLRQEGATEKGHISKLLKNTVW